MSHHGYTVQDGWFHGTCSGHNHQPMETDRMVADGTVAMVRAQVEQLRADLRKVETGLLFPRKVNVGHAAWDGKRFVQETAPFAEGNEYQQKRAVEELTCALFNRAKAGAQFADDLELLCNLHHGEPLQQVVKAEPAPRIEAGERRVKDGQVYVARWQDGGMVPYKRTNTKGMTFDGRMTTRKWRAMEVAA
jgi:hypothetical protein